MFSYTIMDGQEQQEQDPLKICRHLYYIANKEKINTYARERYQMKKNNPEFVARSRLNNQKAYKKIRSTLAGAPKTEEEEEAYMLKIQRDIRENRETDAKYGRQDKGISYKTYLDLF
jgi:hypothetical protein